MKSAAANKQRLFIGGWLLAALLLCGFNGYRYMEMEDPPLQRPSSTIRSLRQKLSRLEQLEAQRPNGPQDLASFQTLFDRYVKKPEPTAAVIPPVIVEAKPEKPKLPVEKVAPQIEVTLPTLTGIVQIQNALGALQYKALLNGRLVQEQDRIDQFTIAAISDRGVVVSALGRQWTIETPSPSHTSDVGY